MIELMNTNLAQPASSGNENLPGVSVILPILNEEKDLELAVGRILEQNYGGPFEVVLAVGPSQDRTLEIAELIATRDKRSEVVQNPTGATPAGLNIKIDADRQNFIVRIEGQS